MEEYDAALQLAIDYFLKTYDSRPRTTVSLEPIEDVFIRWISIYCGLEVQRIRRAPGVTIINVRDAELATMFKLRF